MDIRSRTPIHRPTTLTSFRIKRTKRDTDERDEVLLNFPDIADAIEWMEEENKNPDREFDIASVSLAR